VGSHRNKNKKGKKLRTKREIWQSVAESRLLHEADKEKGPKGKIQATIQGKRGMSVQNDVWFTKKKHRDGQTRSHASAADRQKREK